MRVKQLRHISWACLASLALASTVAAEDIRPKPDGITGAPEEIRSAWERVKGHDCSSAEERDQSGLHALSIEGERLARVYRDRGVNIAFHHAQLLRHEGMDSRTTKELNGVRHHKAWGTAVGYLYFDFDPPTPPSK